ncbi:magnesium transporter NIPA-domain-containing protein [Mycena rebaudengoi]|nr:magnesium transporter NIPA-domain-containing protein [Mycena rebaudengoi]
MAYVPQSLVACYPELDLSQALPWQYTPDIGSKLPELTTGTVIGITVAITGNVLISLALNLQKLAHKRGEAERLIEPAGSSSLHEIPVVTPKKTLLSRLFRSKQDGFTNGIASERTTLLPVNVITEEQAMQTRRPVKKVENNDPYFQDGNEADYLKSRLWWLGFLLMNVGEMGNFISYAWAPASVVAPLGTFALMANCVFAPVMLGERFRKRDLFGILIAVIGAVTVVLASNASDTRLDPDALLIAISQPAFIVYSGVYVAGIIVLSVLSEGKVGKQWVFVDVGVCALFGGFTVLSTKAVSTLLTMEWFEMFTKWITYPVIAVLVLTGIGQIRYLNRALMRFDGKVVIPIQFVFFTISAIIGSAVLYGDFKEAKFHQMVTFLYGCAATFTGVFIIAWEPRRDQSDSDDDPSSAPDDPADIASPDSENDERPPTALSPLGRRRRPTLILPSGFRDQHALLHKQSTVSMLGLSPAQPLLMVHTPPREIPERFRERDAERDASTPSNSTPRRRAISWMGEDARVGSARNGSFGRNSLASAGLFRSDNTSSSPEDDRR